MEKKKVVVLGGGTGLPVLLKALKNYDNIELTGIVNMTDAGRHTGILRKNFSVPAIGDLRNAIVALSTSENPMNQLLEFRFLQQPYEGVSLGNLIILSLILRHGSLKNAIEEINKIMQLKGKVLAVTYENVHVCAELEDGSIIHTEDEIRQPNKPKIKRVFLESSNHQTAEDVPAAEEAVKSIEEADYVICAPGGLFGSIIPNFLFRNLSDALKKTKAKKIMICPLTTYPGQTEGFTAVEHLATVEKYVDEGTFDTYIINSEIPTQNILEAYSKAGMDMVVDDSDKVIDKINVVKANLIAIEEFKEVWDKIPSMRHNPHKLAKVIMKII